MFETGKNRPLWRFWHIIPLLLFLGLPSKALAQARILLNNYDSDCPIVDYSYGTGDVFVEIDYECFDLRLFGTVQVEATGATTMKVNELGFFDGGVGIIPDLPTGKGMVGVDFRMKVWSGGEKFEWGSSTRTETSWYQWVDLSANTTNNVVPCSLKIPGPVIWLLCTDCIIEQYVFTAIKGKGKVELYPLEGTSHYENWKPWGP